MFSRFIVFTAYCAFYEESFESFDPVVDIGMVGVISKYLFITIYISVPKFYLFSFAITITWSAFLSRI